MAVRVLKLALGCVLIMFAVSVSVLPALCAIALYILFLIACGCFDSMRSSRIAGYFIPA